MAITTGDQLLQALGNNSTRVIIDKGSLANQVAGRFTSLWRATGQPAQAAIPTTPVSPTTATLGAMRMTNQTAPASSYLAWMFLTNTNNALAVEVHDRLAHNGGLNLTLLTSQTTTGLDLATLGVSADRLGDANYSDVQWWLEVYADGGATASNATINVTYNDLTTGNLNVLAVGGTVRAGQCFALTPLIPTSSQGKFIKGINSVILSASTGTAGNFGFTATRPRTVLGLNIANKTETADWAALGLPEIANDSCLFLMLLGTTTSSGNLRGGGKIAHG